MSSILTILQKIAFEKKKKKFRNIIKFILLIRHLRNKIKKIEASHPHMPFFVVQSQNYNHESENFTEIFLKNFKFPFEIKKLQTWSKISTDYGEKKSVNKDAKWNNFLFQANVGHWKN